MFQSQRKVLPMRRSKILDTVGSSKTLLETTNTFMFFGHNNAYY